LSHSASLISAAAQAGVSATHFFNNENFSFVGINAGGSLNLTNLVQRMIPRASLSVSDYFVYTPQLPGFLSPTLAPLQGPQTAQPGQPQPVPQLPAGAGFFGPGAGAPQGVNFNGNFAGRANSYTNGTAVSGGYALTKNLSMGAGYTYSISHFGSTFAQPGVGGYFDTTGQSVSVGPSYQLTPVDSISVSGSYSHTDYSNVQQTTTTPAGVTPATNFDSYSGSLAYSHRFSQTVNGSVSGVYTRVSPNNTSVIGGGASVSWLVIEKTSATLTYNRSVAASYVGVGTAMVSDSVMAAIQRVLTPKLSGTGTLMYVHSQAVQDSQSGGFKYDSVVGALGLSYQLSRYFSAYAYYAHSYFQSSSAGLSNSFNLDSVSIGITGSFPYKWS